MWTRAQLKSNGMLNFKKNYWKCVLVALILLLVGGVDSSGSGNPTSIRKNYNQMQEQMNGQFSFSGDLGDDLGIAGSNAEIITAATLIGGIVLVIILIATIIGILLAVLVLNPLQVGGKRFFVANHYQEETELSELAFGFKANYGNVVKTMFFRDLYTFLWSLLFVIPGIVKSYAYRMVPYLLTEHPDMEANEAITLSQQMMMGQKWNAFVLDLSFIGWHILSALTFGILGIFYVNPYKAATDTELYVALKETGAGQPQQPMYS